MKVGAQKSSTGCVMCGEELPEGYGMVCSSCERKVLNEHKEVEK